MSKARPTRKAAAPKRPNELAQHQATLQGLRRLERTMADIDRARRRILSGLRRQDDILKRFVIETAHRVGLRTLSPETQEHDENRLAFLQRTLEETREQLKALGGVELSLQGK